MHEIKHLQWRLTGVVQGVGFRPHVARVAQGFAGQIKGECSNNSRGVLVDFWGTESVFTQFRAAILSDLPPLAAVLRDSWEELGTVSPQEWVAAPEFRIVSSQQLAGARTLIPPDAALCPECLAELRDPANRRYGYAFITCTNCGPRLSIIEDLPYDRPFTTMRVFPMCPACTAEYSNPTDRRYHAQPISCYDCGPQLWTVESAEIPPGVGDPFGEVTVPSQLWDGSRGMRNQAAQEEALATTVSWLREGRIIAVKGLGGFHLLVDAGNEAAVARLRKRKQRDGKPLAVMCRDLATARSLVDLGPEDGAGEQLLTSVAHPIVVASRLSAGAELAQSVSPGLDTLGVMLPYTPLHQLLLDRVGFPLVATSGNVSNEPLCYRNEDALARLSQITDAFLLHNRPIAVPVEDSVVQFIPAQREVSTIANNEVTAQPTLIRRSRGYAPLPQVVSDSYVDMIDELCDIDVIDEKLVILGVGGELKNTCTLVRDGLAFTSAHNGDMETLFSQQTYDNAVTQLTKIHNEKPGLIVCDRHPNYATTAWAARYAQDAAEHGRDIPVITLQHHRAHAFSLLAEHMVDKAVIIAVDGTGYGDDGKIWGSEVFVVDTTEISSRPHSLNWQVQDLEDARAVELAAATRVAHLPYFTLPGGDLAVKEPWRQGLAWLHRFGIPLAKLPLEQCLETPAGVAVWSQLESGQPLAQSCALGRYFDAAAATLGLCLEADHEAAAPVALQTAAVRYWRENGFAGPRGGVSTAKLQATPRDPINETDVERVVDALVKGIRHQVDTAELAFVFHQDLAHILAQAALLAAQGRGYTTVGLTGGSAVNWLLATLLRREIEGNGLRFITQQAVPANDGGLSLGQAYYGFLLTSRGRAEVSA